MPRPTRSHKAQAARVKAAANKTKMHRRTNKQDLVQLLTQLFTENSSPSNPKRYSLSRRFSARSD